MSSQFPGMDPCLENQKLRPSPATILFAFILVTVHGAPLIPTAHGQDRKNDSPRTSPPALLFSVVKWQGDYFSKDVPGGVATSPRTSAIYSINADGTGLKKLVDINMHADNPASSPNGKWVYFQSNAGGRSHNIYRCRPDGSGVENLTAGKTPGKRWREAFGCALSRDGRKMLYTVHDGSAGHVALADADGGNARLIAPELGYIYMAALNPANESVVFSGPARGYRLLSVALPNGKPVELTPDQPDSYVPQFTPDGKTIVFLRRDGDIYRVDADGKNLRRLTTGNQYVEFRLSPQDRHGSTDGPHVSPDGKHIAYIAVKNGVPNVCVMKVDGTGQRQVTFRETPCGRVHWSPDGTNLAFVSFEGKYPQLFVVSAHGGSPRQLTHIAGAVYFVNWRR